MDQRSRTPTEQAKGGGDGAYLVSVTVHFSEKCVNYIKM